MRGLEECDESMFERKRAKRPGSRGDGARAWEGLQLLSEMALFCPVSFGKSKDSGQQERIMMRTEIQTIFFFGRMKNMSERSKFERGKKRLLL